MSKTRTVPGENLSERLSARLGSRAKVGQKSEFYHRLGVENPYDSHAPAQEMAENGMFSFLSASAYYRELKSSRHRMMWRIDSIRHRPVAGERLRAAGPSFARPQRETVLAGPGLHDLVYVDHDAQSSDKIEEASAAFPRSKRRAATTRRSVALRPMQRAAEKHVPAADSALDKRLNEVLATLRTSVRGDTRRALEQAVKGSGAQRERALERVVRGVRGPVRRSVARRITDARVDADQAPIAVAKARMIGGRQSSRSAAKGLRPVLRNSPALVALQPQPGLVSAQDEGAPALALGQSKPQARARVHKTAARSRKSRSVTRRDVSTQTRPIRGASSHQAPSGEATARRTGPAQSPTELRSVARSRATQRSYRRVATSRRPTAWVAALARPKSNDTDVAVARGMSAASPGRSRHTVSEPVPRAARRSLAGMSSAQSVAPLSGAATRWLSDSLHPERVVGARASRQPTAPASVRRTKRLAGAMELPATSEPILAEEMPVATRGIGPTSRRKLAARRDAAPTQSVQAPRSMREVRSQEVASTLRAADRAQKTSAVSLSASPVRPMRLRDELATPNATIRAVTMRADTPASSLAARRVSGVPSRGAVASRAVQPLSKAVALAPAPSATVVGINDASASKLGTSRPIARTRPVKTQATIRAARRADRLPVTDARGVASARPDVIAHVKTSPTVATRAGATRRPLQALSRSLPQAQAALPLAPVVARAVAAESAVPGLERATRLHSRAHAGSDVDMLTVSAPTPSIVEEAASQGTVRSRAKRSTHVADRAMVTEGAKVTERVEELRARRVTRHGIRSPMSRRASQRMAAGIPTDHRVQAAPSPAGFVHAVQAERALSPESAPAPTRKAGARSPRTTARVQARGRNTVRVDHRDRARLVVAPTDYLRVAQAAVAPQSAVGRPGSAAGRPVARLGRRSTEVVGSSSSAAGRAVIARRPASGRSPAPTARLLGQLNRAVVDLDTQSDFAIRTPTLARYSRQSVVPVERVLGRVQGASPGVIPDERVWMQPAEASTEADVVADAQPLARSVSRAPRLAQVLRQVSSAFRASERADVQVLSIDAARRSVRDAPRASAPTIRAMLQADATGRIVQGRATDLRTGGRSGAVALSPLRSTLAPTQAVSTAESTPTSFRRPSSARRRPVAAAWAERRAAVDSSGRSSAQLSAPGSRIVHRAVSPLAMTLSTGSATADSAGDFVAPSTSKGRNLRAGVVGGVSRWTSPFQPNAQPAAASSTTNRVGRRVVRTSSPFTRVDPTSSGFGSSAPMAQPIGLNAARVDDTLEFGDELEADSPRRSRRVRKPLGASVRTSGNLLTALARAGDAEQVVQVILQRSGDLNGLSQSLGGAGVQIARTIAASAAEPQLVPATPRRSGMGPRRRGLRGGGARHTSATNHRTPSMSTVQSAGSQGVGSSNVMKLANKLMKLIHLAEHNRRDEARGQVRMAEDSSAARAEGGGGRPGHETVGEGNMSMQSLKEQVLQEVQHQIELMKQRQGDPDVGNGWW
ncbi:MAG: hypothetical protein GWP91_21000 [Rhodobacterales bacterium]|nr:hypothetical protein [Rhodobacterales bacterium]